MIGVNEMLASDIARMVPVEAIFGRRPAPTPWPSSQPVLALVLAVLPTLEDDLTADLVESLAFAIVDREDELRAVRAVLSEALALSHAQFAEIVRLQKRLADLLDERRRERTAPYSVKPQAQDSAGQHRPAPGRTEEKSLYGKRRVGTAQGRAAQHRHSTGHHRAGGPWT